MSTDAESARAQADVRDAGLAGYGAGTEADREAEREREAGTEYDGETGRDREAETPYEGETGREREAGNEYDGETGREAETSYDGETERESEPGAVESATSPFAATPEPAADWEPASGRASTEQSVEAEPAGYPEYAESAGTTIPESTTGYAQPATEIPESTTGYAQPGAEYAQETPEQVQTTSRPETGPVSALAPESTTDFRERWHEVQAEFVDDPRHAVEEADKLVTDIARAFTEGVEARRRSLTSAWQHDGEHGESDAHAETEELRLTLRQYRELADHMLDR